MRYREWKREPEGRKRKELHEIYKEARRKFKKATKNAKRQEWCKFAADLESTRMEDPKMFFKSVARLQGDRGSSLPEVVKNSEGEDVSDIEEKAEVWAAFFEKLGKENEEDRDKYDEDHRRMVEDEVE